MKIKQTLCGLLLLPLLLPLVAAAQPRQSVGFNPANAKFYTNGVEWIPSTGSTNSPRYVMADFTLNTPVTNTTTSTMLYLLTYRVTSAGSASESKLSIYGNHTGAAAVTNLFPLNHATVIATLVSTNTYTVMFPISSGGRWYPTNESAGGTITLVTGSMGYQQIVAGTNGATGATGPAGGPPFTNLVNYAGAAGQGTYTNYASQEHLVGSNPSRIFSKTNAVGATNFHSAMLTTSTGVGFAFFDDLLAFNNIFWNIARDGTNATLFTSLLQSNRFVKSVNIEGNLFLPAPSGSLSNLVLTPDGRVIAAALPSGGGVSDNQAFTGTNRFQGAFGGITIPLRDGKLLDGTNRLWSGSLSADGSFGVTGLHPLWDYFLQITNVGANKLIQITNVQEFVGTTNLAANAKSLIRIVNIDGYTVAYNLSDTNRFPNFQDLQSATNGLLRAPFIADVNAAQYAITNLANVTANAATVSGTLTVGSLHVSNPTIITSNVPFSATGGSVLLDMPHGFTNRVFVRAYALGSNNFSAALGFRVGDPVPLEDFKTVQESAIYAGTESLQPMFSYFANSTNIVVRQNDISVNGYQLINRAGVWSALQTTRTNWSITVEVVR